MMKQLAVTLFALSLVALGCGSDDGGKKDAAPKLDTPPVGAEVQPPPPDAPMGPEVTPPGPEVGQPDNKPPAVDQAVDQAPPADVAIDQPVQIDGRTVDAGADGSAIDTSTVDTAAGEAAKPIDGGVDGGSTG